MILTSDMTHNTYLSFRVLRTQWTEGISVHMHGSLTDCHLRQRGRILYHRQKTSERPLYFVCLYTFYFVKHYRVTSPCLLLIPVSLFPCS